MTTQSEPVSGAPETENASAGPSVTDLQQLMPDDGQSLNEYTENDELYEPLAPPEPGDAEDLVWVDEFGESFAREVGRAPAQPRVGTDEMEG